MLPAPRQEVICLALPPTLRHKLLSAGFRTVADLADIRPVSLARELQISHEEALLIIKVSGGDAAQEGILKGAKSAAQLLAKEKAARKILTFCNELDSILGGGISTGQITEFCGVPGVGKTQLGIQLAIDVQIPKAIGGLEGAAVYIDTEGSFMLERVVDMADAMVKHLKKLASAGTNPAHKSAADNVSRDVLLDRIHYFRARDLTEQLAVTTALPVFVEQHPEVKVIVIDSITFHLRQDLQDMAHRARLLAQMAQDLMRLAEERDLAVVLMNQVTTKITNDQSRIVPALGDSWAHAATNRVILYWQEQQRCAFVYKSPFLPARKAEYLVTAEGIRGRRPQKRHRPEDAENANMNR